MPDIFQMPSIAEQLGPSLQQLTGSIQHFINPNHDIQVQLRAELAKNPEMLQKLIDLGPETVGQIFGKQAAFLGQGDPSLGEKIKRDASTMYANNPDFKAEAVASATNTKTQAERNQAAASLANTKATTEHTTAETTGQNIANRVNQATEQAQIDQVKATAGMATQKLTDIQTAVNKIPDIGTIDVAGVAHRMAAGRSTPQDAIALQRLQQVGVDLNPIVGSINDISNRAMQWSIANLRSQSKEIKSGVLAATEHQIDDIRGRVQLANSEMNKLESSYLSDKLLTDPKKNPDKTSPLYQQALMNVQQYDAAKTQRDNYQQMLDNNLEPKRIALINDLSAADEAKKRLPQMSGGDITGGSSISASPIGLQDVIPPVVKQGLDLLSGLSPKDRQIQLDDLKAKAPDQYTKLAPYLITLNKTTTPTPTAKTGSDVMNLIKSKVQENIDKKKKPKLDSILFKNPAAQMDR